MQKIILKTLTAAMLLIAANQVSALPDRTECIAPAKPGGGFDLTCKLVQVSLLDTQQIDKPMRVTYMPGGIGAVAYNAIVAQRPAESGTIVAFSDGSLLNLAQGKFGRYNQNDVRWLASVGSDYGMIAVRDDSPYTTLKELMDAFKKDPNNIVFGAGGSIGSQDWMKTALLAEQINIDPRKMRYVAFEGGGEVLTALLGKHIQVMTGDMSEMIPYLDTKKVRVLAVFSEQRLGDKFANIPTAKEQGYHIVWPIIRGFYMGPKVTDAEFNQWVEIFQKLQQTDEFKKQRELRGLFEYNLTGSELDQYVKKQIGMYRERARSFGLSK